MANHIVTSVSETLKKIGQANPEIISIYVYGGFVRSPKTTKDIDMLVILENSRRPLNLLNKLDSELRGVKLVKKLDINYRFESELEHYIYVDKSMAFYIDIARSGKLVYGASILDAIKDKRPPIADIYRRTVELAHRARHFHFNQIEVDFWAKKFKKWVVYILAATHLYLTNEYDKDLKVTAQKFINQNKEFKDAEILFTSATPDSYSFISILERLRLFLERRLPKTVK